MGTFTPYVKVAEPRPGSLQSGEMPVRFTAYAGTPGLDDGSSLVAVVAYLNGKLIFKETGDLGEQVEVDTVVDTTLVPNGLAYLITYVADMAGYYRTQRVILRIQN